MALGFGVPRQRLEELFEPGPGRASTPPDHLGTQDHPVAEPLSAPTMERLEGDAASAPSGDQLRRLVQREILSLDRRIPTRVHGDKPPSPHQVIGGDRGLTRTRDSRLGPGGKRRTGGRPSAGGGTISISPGGSVAPRSRSTVRDGPLVGYTGSTCSRCRSERARHEAGDAGSRQHPSYAHERLLGPTVLTVAVRRPILPTGYIEDRGLRQGEKHPHHQILTGVLYRALVGPRGISRSRPSS